MLNFNFILVPTDLSQYSLRALDHAVALAQQFDADLHIVYVHEPLPRVPESAWQDEATDRGGLEQTRTRLEQIVRERIPSTVSMHSEVVQGGAAREIVKAADRHKADLIVMATHGRSGLKHMLMGSTTETVIRRAKCPVLALKQPMAVSAETTQ